MKNLLLPSLIILLTGCTKGTEAWTCKGDVSFIEIDHHHQTAHLRLSSSRGHFVDFIAEETVIIGNSVAMKVLDQAVIFNTSEGSFENVSEPSGFACEKVLTE